MNSLSHVRVLDLSRLLPGPYATQLLANLGAQVIKIERPSEGDYARSLPPLMSPLPGDPDVTRGEGAVFWQNNRGKQSVGIDFDSERGRAILLRLLEHADVLLESFRPGTLARRGLDYASVRARNARLIYCSLSGYGQTGPHQQRAGHDLNYLALAGILKLNGARGQTPVPPSVQMADLAGGMSAALQIVAALLERERTGQGNYLDIALLDVAVDWMQSVIGASFRAEGTNPRRGELPLSGAYPCYNIYETADGGFISLGALEPSFWRAFCMGVQRADLLERQFDATSILLVAALFKTHTRAEWIEFSWRVDCCLEPLLDVSETLEHPQVVARRSAASDEARRVPRLGEHTTAVLLEVGYTRGQIEELRSEGVIV